MKTLILWFALLLAVPSVHSADEQSLRAALDSMVSDVFIKPDMDMARVARMIAPSYVHTSGETGEVWDRDRWLAFAAARQLEVKDGRWRVDTYEVSDQTIRMHGSSAAVVTLVLKSSGVRLDRPYAYQHRITQLWTKANGHWMRAAYHDSPLSPAAVRVNVFVPEAEVLAFEKRRRDAVAVSDLEILASTSAPDLIYVNATNGIERNKQEYLDHIRVEDIAYNSYSLEDRTVKVFGDLAVTTGTFVFNVTVNGHVRTGAQYYTAVYTRNEGHWQVLIWHPTVVRRADPGSD